MPQSHWPLGRIIDIYKGSNNTVCVVKLKMPSSETVRPVLKVALLGATQG